MLYFVESQFDIWHNSKIVLSHLFGPHLTIEQYFIVTYECRDNLKVCQTMQHLSSLLCWVFTTIFTCVMFDMENILSNSIFMVCTMIYSTIQTKLNLKKRARFEFHTQGACRAVVLNISCSGTLSSTICVDTKMLCDTD